MPEDSAKTSYNGFPPKLSGGCDPAETYSGSGTKAPLSIKIVVLITRFEMRWSADGTSSRLLGRKRSFEADEKTYLRSPITLIRNCFYCKQTQEMQNKSV